MSLEHKGREPGLWGTAEDELIPSWEAKYACALRWTEVTQ